MTTNKQDELDERAERIALKLFDSAHALGRGKTKAKSYSVMDARADIRAEIRLEVIDVLRQLQPIIERLDLEFDVVVCDCGEPYKDTDPHDVLKELLSAIQTLKEVMYE